MKRIKRILTLLLALATALSLAACGTQKDEPAAGDDGTAAEEKKLVIYSAATDAQVNAVVPLFEERYGIEVEVITGGTGELLARIEVQLRHRARVPAPQPGGDVLRVGAWTVDRAARTLAVDGADVPLTRTEFNIVELLALHPKKVYTKQELFELAWGEPYAAEDSTVSVHVSNIRAKLKPTGTDGYLCTVWGLGFKLAVDEGA